MKNIVLILFSIFLISCTNHLEKKYSEIELESDLKILQKELTEKDFKLLNKTIIMLDYNPEKLKKLSYSEILKEGKKFKEKIENFQYEIIQKKNFEREKIKRYKSVISKLKIIREAQIKYYNKFGKYTKNKSELLKYTQGENIDLFKVPYTEKEFEIDTSTVEKVKGLIIPVFIVKTDKDSILNGLNSKLIEREKEAISSDEIKGEFLSVGSLENVLTSGNWPDKYD